MAGVIRRGRADELPSFAELFRDMQRDIGADVSLYPNDWREKFAAFCADQRAFRFYVAEEYGQIVGSAGAHFWRPPFPHMNNAVAGYVWGVCVKPSFRRRGYGAAPTRMALADLRQEGCVEVRLHASKMARSLYEHLGFTAGSEMRLLRRD